LEYVKLQISDAAISLENAETKYKILLSENEILKKINEELKQVGAIYQT